MKKSILKLENYFNLTNNLSYLSNSQVHDFIGVPAKPGCEAMTIAKLKGKWKTEPTNDMLIGSYVDAFFSKEMDEFKLKNPGIFKKDGSLYSQFINADNIIKYALKDEFFMKYLSGKPQQIVEGEIFNFPFKGKIDSLHEQAIIDLKVMKDMNPIWCNGHGKMNFIDAWGIPDQLAIYQELEFQRTGIKKKCYIAVLTKEKQPNKEIIYIPDERLEVSIEMLRSNIKHIIEVKTGIKEPVRCENCDYCKSTKKLDSIKHYNDFWL